MVVGDAEIGTALAHVESAGWRLSALPRGGAVVWGSLFYFDDPKECASA